MRMRPRRRCCFACRALAQRIEFLERQDRDLSAEIDTLTTALNPPCAPPTASAPTPLHAAHHRWHQYPPAPFEAAFAMLAGWPRYRPRQARRPDIGSPAAETELPTTPCTIALVRWSHDRRTRERRPPTRCRASKKDIPAATQARNRPGDVPTNAPSTTTATYAPPAKHATSPSPQQPTTSVSGPTPSPDSNVDSNATTPRRQLPPLAQHTGRRLTLNRDRSTGSRSPSAANRIAHVAPTRPSLLPSHSRTARTPSSARRAIDGRSPAGPMGPWRRRSGAALHRRRPAQRQDRTVDLAVPGRTRPGDPGPVGAPEPAPVWLGRTLAVAVAAFGIVVLAEHFASKSFGPTREPRRRFCTCPPACC